MTRNSVYPEPGTGKASGTRRAVTFNITHYIRHVCADMAARLPELAHLDLNRIAFGFRQTRLAVSHGMYASLTPLRFEGGARETLRRGRKYTVQKVLDEAGREMLYVLNVYLPRFLETSYEEKLVTLMHELWHIGPAFDGDLRRFHGRCHVHSHSQAEYDAEMKVLVDRWLAHDPPGSLTEFLRHSFHELRGRYGKIIGAKIAAPKLVPVDGS